MWAHPLYILFTTLSIFRDKLPNSKRRVLVPQSYIEIDLNFLKYEVEEVFPWVGISVIFSFCASISRVGVPSHEIEFELDFRYVNIFHGAWIYQKVETIVM